MQAACWLVNNSALYQDEGIFVDVNWLCSLHDFVHEVSYGTIMPIDKDQSSANLSQDEWSKDEAEIPAGVTDSMLTSPNFENNVERQAILHEAT